jgi:hypothetical protein
MVGMIEAELITPCSKLPRIARLTPESAPRSSALMMILAATAILAETAEFVF